VISVEDRSFIETMNLGEDLVFESYAEFIKRKHIDSDMWVLAVPVVGWFVSMLLFGFVTPVDYFIRREKVRVDQR